MQLTKKRADAIRAAYRFYETGNTNYIASNDPDFEVRVTDTSVIEIKYTNRGLTAAIKRLGEELGCYVRRPQGVLTVITIVLVP